MEGLEHARARQLRAPSRPGRAARVASDVLMPFHSITTSDSVEGIRDGLAKSPSEVLEQSTSRPIHVVLRQ